MDQAKREFHVRKACDKASTAFHPVVDPYTLQQASALGFRDLSVLAPVPVPKFSTLLKDTLAKQSKTAVPGTWSYHHKQVMERHPQEADMPGAPLKGEGGGSQSSIHGIWLNGFGERPLGGASQGCKLGGLYGTRVASGRSTPAWEQLLFMIRADGDMRMRFLFEVTMREFLEKHLDSLTWKSIAVAAEGCGRHLGAKGPLCRGDRGSKGSDLRKGQ